MGAALRGLVTACTFALAGFGLSACGGGGGGGGSSSTTASVSSVEVSPTTATLAQGTTQQFTATALYSNGTKADVTATASWTSSDTTIAGVVKGLVSAVKPGSVTVSASLSGKSGSANATVTPAVVTGISVTPPSASLPNGASQQFIATAQFSDSTTQDVSTSASWSTADGTIATVTNGSGGGLVKGLSLGTTSVVAFFQGYSAKVQLTVTAAALAQITVTPASAQAAAGTTYKFYASAVYTDSTSQDITTQASWSSSASAIATVSNDSGTQGLATGVTPGNASITASYGGLTGSGTLTVVSAVLVGVQVNPLNPSIPKGTAQAFTATAIYSDQSKQDVTTAAIWSSDNTAIATISNASGSNGLAQGVSPGTANITATFQSQTSTTLLTVGSAVVTAIAVVPQNPTLPVGFTQQFTAAAQYSDGSVLNVTSSATWLSSDSTIATINSSSSSSPGLATAVAVGQTTISASLGGITASSTLTVSSAVLSSIQVTPAAPSVPIGTTQQFTATGVFSDQSTQDITTTVTWVSSSPGIATISNSTGSNGLASANTLGNTQITAAFGGISGKTQMTVSSATLARVQVTPASATIPSGLTQQFTATAIYTDNSIQNVTALATWSSSNTSTATISNASGSQGLATGAATGTSQITASYGGQTSSSATLTVSSAVLSSIQVSPSGYSIPKGYKRAYRATGVYSDNSKSDLTSSVVWTSTAPTVATISSAQGSAGIATGLGAGSASFVATLRGIQGSVAVTVTNATLSSIDIQPVAPSIPVGAQQQFSATGLFSDSTSLDLSTQVSWSSSSTGIATVSSSGLAVSPSGGASGATTISAALGGKTGSSVLTVRSASLLSIQLAPAAAQLPLGQSLAYQAIGLYSDQSTADLSKQVIWSSSDTTVASVGDAAGSSYGVAQALAAGSVTITATLGSVSASTPLTVTTATLQSLTITPVDPQLPAGYRGAFSVVGVYSDNTTLNLTNAVTWSSSAAGVATVSDDPQASGSVLTVALGTAVITAQYSGLSVISTITVSGATLSSIAILPSPPTVAAGFSTQLQAIGSYSDGSQVDISSQVTWTSTSTSVVDISNAAGSQGLATARVVGTATITATNPGGVVAGSASFTTTNAILQSIAITSQNTGLTAIPAGYSAPFIATGQYSDGSKVTLTTSVAWTTADSTIATVSNDSGSQGQVKGIAAGATSVLASLDGVTGSLSITVSSATLSSILVTPLNPTISAGTSLQFHATGTFSDSTVLDLTTQATWTSSNPNAIAVSNAPGSQGVATARALPLGTAIISATLNGRSGGSVAQVG